MRHFRFSRRIGIIAALAVVAGALLMAAFLSGWLLTGLPPIDAVEQRLVRPTTQILDRNGRLLYERIDPDAGKQIDLSLDAVPDACIQATLATEDSRFFLHPGVDPIAIARALWQNVTAGGQVVSGASTLTQQLARSLLMEPEERYQQTVRRKLREAWLAWRLELRYTKSELLALYLNQSYYGNWAFGMEAAAQTFFGKPAQQLSRAECAVLAGLIQYPVGYNPLQYPETAKERQLTVLRLMREAGFLDPQEEALVASEPLRFRSSLFDIQAPHFVMYVQALLADDLGVDRLRDGGLVVTTTLDLDLQTQAEAMVRYRLDQLNCRVPGSCDELTDPNRRVDNAAAIVLNSQSGEILAMVGSPDYFDASIQGNVNAALSLRQPGSAIKPLTYAAALDPTWSQAAGRQPLTPASILADLPSTFYVTDVDGSQVPYAPQNYDRSFHGPVSVRSALANSYNIPAVKVLDQLGVSTLQEIAAASGISTFTDEYGLALALGGGEVKLLELTAAYGVLDDGRKLETSAIMKIKDRRSGNGADIASTRSSIFDLRSPGPSVISPAAAYLITDILADSTARMPAFGQGSVLDLPFASAVKTGTTTDWRDNWTVGYSSERIVGVWVGNADNSPMLDVSGIDGAGPIWRDLMLAAHADPPPPFQRPAGIVQATICAPSGMLPTAYCTRTRREQFIAGTEPTEADNQFLPVAVDLATGQLASAETPAERVAERVYWYLPSEYSAWMERQGIAQAPRGSGAPRSLSEDAQAVADLSLAPSSAERGNQGPLVLSAPASNIAYQIHPRIPRENQRIKINGFASDGESWDRLDLVVDDQVLASASETNQIESWWTLEPGEHLFWIQGHVGPETKLVRSAQALVVVEPYSSDVARTTP